MLRRVQGRIKTLMGLVAAPITAATPEPAGNFFGSFRDMVGLVLHGAIGAFGGFAIALFIGGFILYIVRLGTERRIEGINMMAWAIRVLFIVVIVIVIDYFIGR